MYDAVNPMLVYYYSCSVAGFDGWGEGRAKMA